MPQEAPIVEGSRGAEAQSSREPQSGSTGREEGSQERGERRGERRAQGAKPGNIRAKELAKGAETAREQA